MIQLAANAVVAKLIGATDDVKLGVSNLLSFMVAGAEHMEAFKSHSWDGRSTLFNYSSATFPAGFLNLVYTYLKQQGHDVQVVRKPAPKPLGPVRPVVDEFDYSPEYDYQPETVDRLIRHRAMIAQVATGGGKSRIACIAAARIKRPTLFLTTRSVLMHQMKRHFEKSLQRRSESGESELSDPKYSRVGVMGDGVFKPARYINVGMVQTIAARLEDKTERSEVDSFLERQANAENKKVKAYEKRLVKEGRSEPEIRSKLSAYRGRLAKERLSDKELAARIKKKVAEHREKRRQMIKILNMFELVILEEAHESSGFSYYDIMNHCRNAHYRLALTATPFMREDEEDNMRLMACSGPIGIRVSEKMLIDLGILATPYFKYLDPQKPRKLFPTTPWQRAYEVGIMENTHRNKAIIDEARRAAAVGLPIMILVTRRDHGRLLEEMMVDQGIRTVFIFGDSDDKERQRQLSRLKAGEIQALIGSTILDVGVDVPAVGMVILAGGGKAEVALRQRVGRGLRRKSEGPNVCFIVDFNDRHNKHLMKHSLQRRGVIENTEGFGERILPTGQDFDYSVFPEYTPRTA